MLSTHRIMPRMGNPLKALLLGIIEGLTEFFPVSSTGHLILAGDILSFPEAVSEHFHVAIQLGAIAAVVLIYRADFFKLLHPKSWTSPLFQNLVCVTIPSVVAGILFYDSIKTYLFNPVGVACALIFGAVAMLFVDKKYGKSRKIQDISKITPREAFVIGITQCMALWPGMSRSASTMMGGLYMGLDYKTAAKFSFMAAVPVMMAAVAYDFIQGFGQMDTPTLQLIGIGMVVAFIVSILGIKTLLKILNTFGFKPFAYYRIILGAIILGIYFL
jgi:undecaprenyl-diphosphatase